MKRLLLLAACCLPLAGCYDTSDGEMVGQITYFTKHGIFCKTWEGQAILGGMRKEAHLSSDGKSSVTSSVANTATFTVEDLSLVPKVQAAFEAGAPVRLRYKKELITFCRADSDDTFLTAVVP